MSDHVYRSAEITGSSSRSIDDAIRTGIAKAAETLRNIDWFEVVSVRGHVENAVPSHIQVTMKVGFRLE